MERLHGLAWRIHLYRLGTIRDYANSMTADQDKFVKVVFHALGEWWGGLGALAWLLLGVFLVGSIIILLFVLRWILRGGLSRRMALGLSGHQPTADKSSRRDP